MNKSYIETNFKSLAAKEFSAEELTLTKISQIESNKSLNAFISILKDDALLAAKTTDKRISDGNYKNLLDGTIAAAKDNILVKDRQTTCASKMLQNYCPSYSATAITRLSDNGVINIGKTNMDEFAMGVHSDTSFFGPVINPINKLFSPGGSSGGSAAAVSAGLSLFALGTDTAGSARIPATFCGISAIKPTYATVSRYGLAPLVSSMDQISPIAKSIRDLEIVYSALKGYDPNDETTFRPDEYPTVANESAMPKTIGICKKAIDLCEPTIKAETYSTISALESKGYKIVDIELPHLDYALATYYIIGCAEISSNLARYDGLRRGYSTKSTYLNIEELTKKNRSEAFGDEVKKRIMLGIFYLSGDAYQKYFMNAQKMRTEIIQDFENAYSKCDLIILPVTPYQVPKISEIKDLSVKKRETDIFTVLANITGFPAVSLPVSKDSNNMPVGIQLMGPKFSEQKLFSVAKIIEDNTAPVFKKECEVSYV